MNKYSGISYGSNRHVDGWESFEARHRAAKAAGKKLKIRAGNGEDDVEESEDPFEENEDFFSRDEE